MITIETATAFTIGVGLGLIIGVIMTLIHVFKNKS